MLFINVRCVRLTRLSVVRMNDRYQVWMNESVPNMVWKMSLRAYDLELLFLIRPDIFIDKRQPA